MKEVGVMVILYKKKITNNKVRVKGMVISRNKQEIIMIFLWLIINNLKKIWLELSKNGIISQEMTRIFFKLILYEDIA